jgi:hypothetical protein
MEDFRQDIEVAVTRGRTLTRPAIDVPQIAQTLDVSNSHLPSLP